MENKIIVTMDFYFTALLLSKGFEMLGSEKHERGVVFIVQNNNENLYRKLKEQFDKHDAYVNMSKFVKNTALLRKELDKHK